MNCYRVYHIIEDRIYLDINADSAEEAKAIAEKTHWSEFDAEEVISNRYEYTEKIEEGYE